MRLCSSPVCWGVTDCLDVAMRIKYVGSQEAATVEVEAVWRDLVFQHGDVGATSSDYGVEGTGTIDVDALTVGEVVDIINATDNWRAVMVDSLRTDSTNFAFVEQLPTDAKVPGGLTLLWDTGGSRPSLTRLIAPESIRDHIEVYFDSDGKVNPMLPFIGTKGSVHYMYGGGVYKQGYCRVRLYSEDAAGNLIVEYQKEALADGLYGALLVDSGVFSGRTGERAIARLENEATIASAVFRGQGRLRRVLS